MKTTLLPLADKFHSAYTNILSYAQHPLLLLIRLYWGYDFFQTGLGKLNNLEGTTEFFTSLNIPFPYLNAIAAGSTELICGILLMIGFGSRYFTLPLIIILSMAYATDDREALTNIFSDTESFVAATPFNHLLASFIILIFGAGNFSVDGFLKRFRNNKT
ncbi:MAG: DoxX family protein [Bacteroidota bacterium]|nr:DoxX family protein [Bacteroidota bacterium]